MVFTQASVSASNRHFGNRMTDYLLSKMHVKTLKNECIKFVKTNIEGVGEGKEIDYNNIRVFVRRIIEPDIIRNVIRGNSGSIKGPTSLRASTKEELEKFHITVNDEDLNNLLRNNTEIDSLFSSDVINIILEEFHSTKTKIEKVEEKKLYEKIEDLLEKMNFNLLLEEKDTDEYKSFDTHLLKDLVTKIEEVEKDEVITAGDRAERLHRITREIGTEYGLLPDNNTKEKISDSITKIITVITEKIKKDMDEDVKSIKNIKSTANIGSTQSSTSSSTPQSIIEETLSMATPQQGSSTPPGTPKSKGKGAAPVSPTKTTTIGGPGSTQEDREKAAKKAQEEVEKAAKTSVLIATANEYYSGYGTPFMNREFISNANFIERVKKTKFFDERLYRQGRTPDMKYIDKTFKNVDCYKFYTPRLHTLYGK